MFDVERSGLDRITIRDNDAGHCWTFMVVVDERDGRTLASHGLMSTSNDRGGVIKAGPEAFRYAEMEAWKRGMID